MLKSNFKNRSILVVDPDEGCRKTLKMVLRNLGSTQLFEAETAVQTLKILKKHRLDLVISEVQLPKISGVQLLQGLRGQRKLAAWSVPFLLMTQLCEKGVVIAARDSGADGFVMKPVQPAVLIKRLSEIFSGNRLIFDLWLARGQAPRATAAMLNARPIRNAITMQLSFVHPVCMTTAAGAAGFGPA